MTRTYEFARRLIDRGHDVTVVTLPGYLPAEYQGYRRITRLTIEGVPVILIPVAYSNYMSFSQRMVQFIKFALLASWVSMRQAVDVVYASSGPLTIAIPAIAARAWQRIPMVFEVRDLWPRLPIAIGALKNPVAKQLALLLEWVAYHAATHVVALSPGMKEGVIARGIAVDKITVIPNSCDLDLFDVPESAGAVIRERLGLSEGQPLVVYAGTFGRMNHVGFLVELAHSIRAHLPECRFLLIGSGAEFEQVTAQAAEMGLLDKSVFIWKPVPKSEMPAILAAATIATSMFLPVREMWDNSANKFFDALAAGRPIAINYGGWQADILKETGIGIQLSENDPEAAARTLADFLSSSDRLAHARLRARELAYHRFHRDVMARDLEQVLRKAVGEDLD